MNFFTKFTITLVICAIVLGTVCSIMMIGKHIHSNEVQKAEESTVSTDLAAIPDQTDDSPSETNDAISNPSLKDACIQAVEKEMSLASGNCQWGFCLFDSNEQYTTASFTAPSASVIKVFIMEYAFNLIEKGELSLDETISGKSVKALIHSMITQSDNYSTNVLIEHFGMDAMNQFFAENNYHDTKIQRKMLDTNAQKAGKDNYTSVQDAILFLNKLYQNRTVKPYSSMLDIMKQQQVRTKIPRLFPAGVTIANKTGELSNVENDIGIIFGEKGDYAAVFLCSGVSSTQSARDAISNAAYHLYLTAEGKQ